MNWFRRHIKLGSRLALISLAIQFVLAFGHSHAARAQTAPVQTSPSYIALISAAIEAESNIYVTPPEAPAGNHEHEAPRPPTDSCAICAVMAMVATALFGSPPILKLPEAFTFLYLATDAGFTHIAASHRPFQPRAPPLS